MQFARPIGAILLFWVAFSAASTLAMGPDSRRYDVMGWLFLAAIGVLGWVLFARTRPATGETSLNRMARFVAQEKPIALGGVLKGTLRMSHRPAVGRPVRVLLACRSRELREHTDRERTKRVSEHSVLIGETTERLIAPEEWRRTDAGYEATIQLRVRGEKESSLTAPALGHPAVDWVLQVELPGSRGVMKLEGSVPVFRVGNDCVGTEGEFDECSPGSPAEQQAHLVEGVARILAPAPLAAETSKDHEAALAAAVGFEPRIQAVGGQALTMDRSAARAHIALSLLGAALVLAFAAVVAVCGLFLSSLPYLGPALKVLALVAASALVWGAIARLFTCGGGSDAIWVEQDAIHIGRRGGGKSRRQIARTEIDRIELVPCGNTGTRNLYSVVTTLSPGPGRERRRRRTLVQAVYSVEGASAIGQFLSERLSEPRVPVVRAEGGTAALEWLFDMMGRFRSR